MSSNPPPADWPKLYVSVEEESFSRVQDKCFKYGGLSLACAEIFFDTGECHIYLIRGLENVALQHERKHCEGYDHVGSSALADLWKSYRKAHGR